MVFRTRVAGQDKPSCSGRQPAIRCSDRWSGSSSRTHPLSLPAPSRQGNRLIRPVLDLDGSTVLWGAAHVSKSQVAHVIPPASRPA
jgi:hypothetical protein